ncbi:MAG: hypothetical protein JKX72_09185 [Robiginitomaculum sp.]|nr:hypothetical protein [Robiginitomaculum sp.]
MKKSALNKIAIGTSIAIAFAMSSVSMSTLAHAANSQSFTSTMSAQTTPIRINVVLGDDLAYRADHVSKNRRDRNGTRSLRYGWSGQGKYDQRDLDRLTQRLKKKMESQFAKNGIAMSDTSNTVLNIVITDARPNRPTFEQLKQPGLSLRSFGIGGAKFEASMTSSGSDIGTLTYAWYETDIIDASFATTWTDANRAIDRFARKTARALK